jgi:hypothetical protein
VVHREIVDGKPAWHRRAHRRGFDHIDAAVLSQSGAEFPWAISRIGQYPNRLVLALKQSQASGGLASRLPVDRAATGLGQRAIGDDPGVGLLGQMRLEPPTSAATARAMDLLPGR